MHMDIVSGNMVGLVKSTEGHVPDVSRIVISIDNTEDVVIDNCGTLIDVLSPFWDVSRDQSYSFEITEFNPTRINRMTNGHAIDLDVFMTVYDEQGNCFDNMPGTACIRLGDKFTRKFLEGVDKTDRFLQI